MKSIDLIKGVKQVNGEKLKQTIIDEINKEKRIDKRWGTWTRQDTFRNHLAHVLRKAGIEIPS